MEFNHKEEHFDDEMILLQANLDDMNPEWSSYLMDLLFEAGANDVFYIPIIMKKGRPGMMLNVFLAKAKVGEAEEIIFRESTTLGIRYMTAGCHRLGRGFRKVATRWGDVQVKVGYYQGKMIQFAPEFSDCEKWAKIHSIPLKTVYDEVRRIFMNEKEQKA